MLRATWNSHLSGINADTHLQSSRLRVLCLPFLVKGAKRTLHIKCRPNCAVGVILVSNGNTEDRHYCITDVLLYCPTMFTYLRRHQVEVPGQNGSHILRVHMICH